MYVIEVYQGWIEGARLMATPPVWFWVLIIEHIALVLVIFKLISGNWMGRKKQ